MRVLILGGTGFIGPHHVNAAVERGHDVAVFTRGQLDSKFPPAVEHLTGDRHSDLTSIASRDWDAVIDLATYLPFWVRRLGEALDGRVAHYTFISSISVYDSPGTNATGTSEESPVLEYKDVDDPYSPDVFPGARSEYPSLSPERLQQIAGRYGPLKRECEHEAKRQFGDNALMVRPGYIVGPGDPQPAFAYLLARAAAGGDMLAAGDPEIEVQFIDVRDLADWVIRMAEGRTTGTYNTVGPASPLRFGDMIGAIQEMIPASTSVTWVDPAWLVERSERALWKNVLFWTSAPYGWADTMRMRNERAMSAGLTFHDLRDTAAEIRSGLEVQPAQLLAPDLLECERSLLEEWQRPSVAQ